jgi:hypothetical protein
MADLDRAPTLTSQSKLGSIPKSAICDFLALFRHRSDLMFKKFIFTTNTNIGDCQLVHYAYGTCATFTTTDKGISKDKAELDRDSDLKFHIAIHRLQSWIPGAETFVL